MNIRLLLKILQNRLSANRTRLPFKIILALTYQCNSRCRNCSIWKIYRQNPKLKNDEMSLQDFGHLFRQLRKNLLFLEMTGGEPFLRKDIAQIILLASKILSKDCYIVITTNGFLPRQTIEIVKSILPKIKQNLVIGVSLDGSPSMHEKTRRVENAYEKATQTYLNLRRLTTKHPNFFTHLCYSIFPENAGLLEEFLKKIKQKFDINPSDVSVSYAQDSSLYHLKNKIDKSGSFIKNALADAKYFANILKKEKNSNFFMKNKNKFKIFYFEKLQNFITNPKEMVIPCAALRASAFINPYGNLYPCIEWNKKIGNIKKMSFKKIWYSKQAQKIRAQIKSKRCPNCWTVCDAQPSCLMNWPKKK